MDIPPTYQLTKSITQKLTDIERLKTELYLLPVDKVLEKYTRQRSILKSSLYSARIEGNPQTLEELEKSGWANQKAKHKQEISNLYSALEYVLSQNWSQDLTIDDLKKIHSMIMKGLSGEAGFLRQEPSAIYNTAGIAVYVCPLPHEINSLLTQLLVYCNQEFETLIPVKVALSHIMFEKIHPFLDGNGRLGRIFNHLIFRKWNYDFRGLIPIEEYFDKHRQIYYDLLAENKNDRTEFVEFFLDALQDSLDQVIQNKKTVNTSLTERELDLPPRRLEILNIIRDHQQVSFDFIKRRFLRIPDRTLRFDLQQLVKGSYIIKQGKTRGSEYRAKQ